MPASNTSSSAGASSTALLKSDASAKLADTTLTAGWLVDILWANDERFKDFLAGGKVDEVIAKDLSGQGEGYNSKVYRVSLRLSGAKANDYSVIMKVPYSGDLEKLLDRINSAHTDEESAMSTDMFDPIAMHNVECAFYEATRGIEGFPIARVVYTHQVHSAKDVGVVVLEDLGDEGVKLDYGFYQAQTAQQIKNVVRSYAALHTHQLCATGEAKAQWDAVPCISKMWHDAGVKLIMGVLPGLPECQNGGILKPLVDKIRPTMTVEFGRFSMIDRPTEIGVPLLYVHGDCGGHNMFWKRAADGTASNDVLAFYDFQFACKANPMYDIGRFMMSFVDAEVRRELEPTLVEEYYEHLRTLVAERGGRPLVFGVKQIREAYELAKIHNCTMPVAGLGFMPAQLGHKFAPPVLEAFREKYLLRARLALEDAIESMRKYTPEYLRE